MFDFSKTVHFSSTTLTYSKIYLERIVLNIRYDYGIKKKDEEYVFDAGIIE